VPGVFSEKAAQEAQALGIPQDLWIPEKILQKDPKLFMWYDHAVTRSGE